MPNPTIAEYLVKRLSDLGIDKVFGVPGDYAFPIDDAIEVCPTLQWVACANELNAAYAADGYARLKGAAILSTTYAVGELSALNGVMGSKAHRLPIFHLVGAPSRRITHQRLITHHTLGDGSYGNFEDLSAAACCVRALLTPDNAIEEIERVIREALRQSEPAYIVVPMDYAKMPVVGDPITGQPINQIKRQSSVAVELEGALKAIISRLKAAQNPVVLPSALIARYGLKNKLNEFITKSNIPFAVAPMDKGVMNEGHPCFLGLYNGDRSSPIQTRDIVQGADLILDLGGIILEDLNTGLWSDVIPSDRIVSIHDNWVQLGTKLFSSVALEDILNGLIEHAPRFNGKNSAFQFEQLPLSGQPADKLQSTSLYPRIQRMLRSGDVLVIETGTCMFHLASMRLPDGVSCESQTLWGSIGWATPAALGICMANGQGRTIIVTGDGSHQLTLNDIAAMGRYKIKPIIFVLNNGIYGIEDVLSERGHEYDNIAPVNYHLIPKALGCTGWLSKRVETIKDLEETLETLKTHDEAAYIEVMIPESESQPFPEEIINQIYKFRTPHAG